MAVREYRYKTGKFYLDRFLPDFLRGWQRKRSKDEPPDILVPMEYTEYETMQDWHITAPDKFYINPVHIQEKMMAFTKAKRVIESFVSNWYEEKADRDRKIPKR